MSLSKKIATNTVIQLIGKIISTIIGLFSLALITRYLGQDGFGNYTIIITFLTILAVIADFGLTLVTAQMISGAQNQAEENTILNNLFGFRLLSIIFILLLSPLILYFFPYSQVIKLGIFITAPHFIFPALNQVIIGLLQKKLSMERAVLAEIISRLILIIGVFISWRLNYGLNGILISTTISGFISFIAHYLLAKKFTLLKPIFNLRWWRKIINNSWPLTITITLNLIYLRSDVIFLSLFNSASEVGLYGAAYRVIDVLTTLPFMFTGLILPILATAWLNNKKDYFKLILQKSFDVMVILTMPLVIGGLMLAKPVMVLVAGQDFLDSGPILQLLIISIAAIFIGAVFSHAIIALNKQRKMIGFYIFTSLSSLLAYYILIPKYASLGAAWVTIYSEFLIMLFTIYCVYKYGKFWPQTKIIFKSLLASLIMGVFIFSLQRLWQVNMFNLLLIILLSGIVYFIALFLFKGLTYSDIKIFLKKKNPH